MWTIPFGFAVVPLVYMRNSRSSLSIGSHGHDAGSSETSLERSCHQWSRPSCIGTSLPVRRRTTQRFTPGAASIASSATVLSGTVEPRRHASSCVISTSHFMSFIRSGERVGREAAEDDGVRRAEPRAREHRHRQLRDHAHVDRDRRSLLHAELLERVGEADDVALEVRVRDRARLAFRLAFPVVGDLLSRAGLDVPVDAVEADVQRAAEDTTSRTAAPTRRAR